MKITITRKDWKRGICYDDPCGCLLHRAIARQLGKHSLVQQGFVRIDGRYLDYSKRKHEERLAAAHRDPSLLPITITLR
jgi:hypothetical protein